MRSGKNYIFRIIKWASITLGGLFLLLYIAIQLPPVQRYVVGKITKYLSERTDFNISIEHVSIAWFDRAIFSNVCIEDQRSQPLIKVQKLTIDFDLIGLILDNPQALDEAVIDQAEVYIVKDSITKEFNINQFVHAFSSSSTTPSTQSPSGFLIKELELINSTFIYDNQLHSYQKKGFDYNHFGFDKIDADLSNLEVSGDTFQIDILGLACQEKYTRLPVRYLSTLFRLTPVSMEFRKLDFIVGKSHIRDSISFHFKDIDDMDLFEEKIKIRSRLTNTYLHTDDLSWFAPELKMYNDRWKISGNVTGKISQLEVKDFDVQFGKRNNTLKGNITLTGLPRFDETFINLSLNKSTFFSEDVNHYIKDPDVKNIVNAFKKTTCTGKFIGFPEDFVAHADFYTEIGFLRSDINVKLAYDSLKGSLVTKNFNIGKIVHTPYIQEIDFQGRLIGKGFTLKDAAYELNAAIPKLKANDYTYQYITTHASLADQYFDGSIQINDPNLSFEAKGKVDFRDGKDQLHLWAKLDSAILDKLNITSAPMAMRIETEIQADIQGFKNSNLEGKIELVNSSIEHNKKKLYIPEFLIESRKNQGWRSFHIYSDIVEVNAIGDFSLETIYGHFSSFMYEHQLALQNNDSIITRHYQSKNRFYKESPHFSVDYRFLFKDINPLVNLFIDDFFISNRTILEGRFSKNKQVAFSATTYFDTLNIKGNQFKGLEVELSSSKEETYPAIYADLMLFSKNQLLSTIPETKNLQLEASWINNAIYFKTYIEEKNIENYADVSATVRFLKDTTCLSFDSSTIKLFEKKWSFGKSGKIYFGKGLAFDNVSINGYNQFVQVTGNVEKQLKIESSNFDLSILDVVLTKNIEGKLDGSATITYAKKEKKLVLESTIEVDSLVFDSFPVGMISGKTHWDQLTNTIDISFFIKKENQKILDASGYYQLSQYDSPLDLHLSFNNTNLSILQPFVKNILSDITGVINGDLTVRGKIIDPIVTGGITMSNGGCKVNYLNTRYTVNSNQIVFTEKGIFFKNITLIDEHKKTAVITGSLRYNEKRRLMLDIEGVLSNFKLLNTKGDESESFYGTAIGTGKFYVSGFLDNLYIKSEITTNKGTKIYIPVKGSSQVEKQEFIRFVDKQTNYLTLKKQERKKINLNGIQMDFTLDVTSDALCEIIFDLRVGDIIRSYGDGIIKLKIDTKGEFSMNGEYEIKKGDYKFTLASIINKEFKILSGSKINWYGDPYSASLAIKAAYTQRLSYLPILGLSPDVKPDPVLRKAYPVIVELYLKGSLKSPQINYNIEFKDYPNQAADVPIQAKVVEFKARITSDEQELNRQVFSLIILKKLSSLNSFEVGQFSASRSVSELLSSQLSYLLSQYNENLEIDFDLSDLTSESFSNAQLTLSYSFLGGRLKVTRSGGFTANQTTTNVGNLVGDWTVEYDLTANGKLKMKIFNRTNQSAITSNTNFSSSNNTTAGTSLLHSQSFDSWKELFQKKKKNKKTENNLPVVKDAKKEDELEIK